MIDLLLHSDQGGCSAKIPQDKLMDILSGLKPLKDNNILVDISTSDDAGVYKINDDTALIVTTDFFPPICSDPYEFGQIAAANSLSDVYAMGGKPLLVLNLNMFPSTKMPMEVLGQILEGGQSKINEALAFVMGGHTIDDQTVKYGLAVVGTCHPDKLVTNSGLKENQTLIITKPLGTGVLIAARKMAICSDSAYAQAVMQMKTLNKAACDVMQQFEVKGGTDITGFGLIGHLHKMAESSGVSIHIDCDKLPLIDSVEELLDSGCVPATAFRNIKSVGNDAMFAKNVSLPRKMICGDAQTSGGVVMAVDNDKASQALAALLASGCSKAAIIGETVKKQTKSLYFF